MVFAAVPLLEELVKEVRVGLSLGIGLVAGIDLGNQGIVLGSLVVGLLQESKHDIGHQELAGDLAAKAHDVGVELATGIQGRGHVANQGAAGAGNLVDSVGDTDASAAQCHAKVGLAASNSLAHGLAVDGVMRTGVAVGAAVEHLVASLLQAVGQIDLLVRNDMVATDCDGLLHQNVLSSEFTS